MSMGAWSKFDLSTERYVYFWVDGIYVQARRRRVTGPESTSRSTPAPNLQYAKCSARRDAIAYIA